MSAPSQLLTFTSNIVTRKKTGRELTTRGRRAGARLSERRGRRAQQMTLSCRAACRDGEWRGGGGTSDSKTRRSELNVAKGVVESRSGRAVRLRTIRGRPSFSCYSLRACFPTSLPRVWNTRQRSHNLASFGRSTSVARRASSSRGGSPSSNSRSSPGLFRKEKIPSVVGRGLAVSFSSPNR